MNRHAILREAARALPYERCKEIRADLDARLAAAGAMFPAGTGTGPMGLTPDHVKASPEWRAARAAYDAANADSRAFNAVFAKRFAKQIRAEIDAKRTARLEARSA